MDSNQENSQKADSNQYNDVVFEIEKMLNDSSANQSNEEEQNPESVEKNPQQETFEYESSATGVEEFDALLDGGFPKGAAVLLAGSSGSGKTIFSFQWLFNGIKNDENGIYITLTEPFFKIVENLEKLSFYDRDAIENQKIKIVDLREKFPNSEFDSQGILDFIEEQVKETGAKRLCIDSITAIAYNLDDKSKIRSFIFELGTTLATLGCTSILISEVAEENKYSIYNVEEFISDAILRFDQVKKGDQATRVMRIVKVRGKSYSSEDLEMRITKDGINLFPKVKPHLKYGSCEGRESSGNKILDEMFEGGILCGSTTLLAGATGTGKTLLSLQFLVDGLNKGQTCLYLGFEESKNQLYRNAASFGYNLQDFENKGLLIVECCFPSSKLLEEHFNFIRHKFEENDIHRCVFDSLSSFSKAFDQKKFESFAIRVNGFFKEHKSTTVFTVATKSMLGSDVLTGTDVSTLTDNIVMLRYVEMQGSLESVINILKIRGSSHQKQLRGYKITDKGIEIGEALSNYEGIMTGVSKKIAELQQENKEYKQLIQEKEEMEKNLRQSEQKFRKLFEQSNDAVIIYDKSGNLIDVNLTACELLGYEKDQLLSMKKEQLHNKSTLEDLKKALKETEMKGSNRYESEYLTADGSIVAVDISAKLFDEEKGFYQAIVRDISERKKYEEKIEFKANFEETISNISNLFIGNYNFDNSISKTIEEIAQFNHAEHGHVLLLSDAKDIVEKIYVYGDECVSSIFNGLEGKSASNVSFLLDKLKNQPLLHLTQENEAVKADSNLLQAFQQCSVKSAIIIPLMVNDQLAGMMSFHDVDSSDKYIEDEKQLLKICADVIGNALEQKIIEHRIKVINNQLKKADEVKSEFMKMTSRELRQPLSMIKGYAQILMSGSLGEINEEQQKSFNVMLNNINRMSQTLSDIDDITNFDQGTINFHPTEIDIKSIIDSAIDSSKGKLEEKNIKIDVSCDENLPQVHVDKKRISQVVENLLDNAIKFSDNDSTIEIKIKKDQHGMIKVEVVDHGKGIREEETKKIFDAFYQTEDVKTNKFGGGGIGLSICKGIINVHGGDIWVDSAGENQGATFGFVIPTNWDEEQTKKRLEHVDLFGFKKSSSNHQEEGAS